MSSALRPAQKAASLASALTSLRSPSASGALLLPQEINKLEVHYQGLKGNAGARHWAKEVLPGLRYRNERVEVVVAPKPAAGAEAAWKQPPGVVLSFHDSPRPAFIPFPASTPSATLAKQFAEAVSNVETLKTLGERPTPVAAAPAPAAEAEELKEAPSS